MSNDKKLNLGPLSLIAIPISATCFFYAFTNLNQQAKLMQEAMYLGKEESNNESPAAENNIASRKMIRPGIYILDNGVNKETKETINLMSISKKTKRAMEPSKLNIVEDTGKKIIVTNVSSPKYSIEYEKIWECMSIPQMKNAKFNNFKNLFSEKILKVTSKCSFSHIEQIALQHDLSLEGFPGNTDKNYKIKYGTVSPYNYPKVYIYVEAITNQGKPVVKYASPNAEDIAEKIYPSVSYLLGGLGFGFLSLIFPFITL